MSLNTKLEAGTVFDVICGRPLQEIIHLSNCNLYFGSNEVLLNFHIGLYLFAHCLTAARRTASVESTEC